MHLEAQHSTRRRPPTRGAALMQISFICSPLCHILLGIRTIQIVKIHIPADCQRSRDLYQPRRQDPSFRPKTQNPTDLLPSLTVTGSIFVESPIDQLEHRQSTPKNNRRIKIQRRRHGPSELIGNLRPLARMTRRAVRGDASNSGDERIYVTRYGT
jgi:hypothetical protein